MNLNVVQDYSKPRKLWDKSPVEVLDDLDRNPNLRVTDFYRWEWVLRSLADKFMRKRGEFSLLLRLYETCLRLGQKAYSSNHRKLGQVHHGLGAIYYEFRQMKQAAKHYEKAIEIYRSEGDSSKDNLAECLGIVAHIYQKSNPHKSQRFLQEARLLSNFW